MSVAGEFIIEVFDAETRRLRGYLTDVGTRITARPREAKRFPSRELAESEAAEVRADGDGLIFTKVIPARP